MNVSHDLRNSSMNPQRDGMAIGIKFGKPAAASETAF